jgi:hypothetical protein
MLIVDEFSKSSLLPVKIDDVAKFIIDRGFVSKIRYHGFDMDPSHLAGMLLHDKPAIAPPYSDPDEIAHIVYSSRLSREMQRLVQTKELVHICDVNAVRVSTRGQVSELVDWFGIPADARAEIEKISPGIASDQSGVLLALAVLFPEQARAALKPEFDRGAISASAIAVMAQLPIEYVGLLMMDNWPRLIETLKGLFSTSSST